ncbi:hypothetical protein OG539_32590 [Actinacidiphila glaucinigra]|uniref:hypothetical protein n=1 Tax=Actinacidiphila glaucinigra TaxID=235986 RepID=UPI0032555029
MDTSTPTITPETARHVLWLFGEGGIQPGSFTIRLFATFSAADPQNFARLEQAFPEFAAAIAAATYDPDGTARLQAIAKGDLPAEQPAAPQCPEALFNPDTDDLRRCINTGWHEDHQTVDGAKWHIAINTNPEGCPF